MDLFWFLEERMYFGFLVGSVSSLLTLSILSPLNFRCAATCTCHSWAKQVLEGLGSSQWLSNWVAVNSVHQLIDEWARAFTGFLGTIARKPHMCLIKYLDWRDVPAELKEECWRLVEVNQELIILVIMAF